MQNEIVISGFGGQGVLFAGQVLAYAAMKEGKEVTWIPSYGPEMRGGTANCTVIVATEEIGSPFVRKPQAVIAMNLPSLQKYEDRIIAEGCLILNTSLIDQQTTRTDLRVIEVEANALAEDIGDKRLANMVLFGALLDHLPLVSLDSIASTLADRIPKKRAHLVDLNMQAINKGLDLAHLEKTATFI